MKAEGIIAIWLLAILSRTFYNSLVSRFPPGRDLGLTL
jgi:hypothetical protein